MRLLNVLAVSGLLLAADQRAVAHPPPDGEIIHGLPMQWQPALAAAVALFSRQPNPHPECFKIHAQLLEEALLVTFVPGRPLPQDANLRGGATSCGRTVSFLMSRDGRLLRQSYPR